MKFATFAYPLLKRMLLLAMIFTAPNTWGTFQLETKKLEKFPLHTAPWKGTVRANMMESENYGQFGMKDIYMTFQGNKRYMINIGRTTFTQWKTVQPSGSSFSIRWKHAEAKDLQIGLAIRSKNKTDFVFNEYLENALKVEFLRKYGDSLNIDTNIDTKSYSTQGGKTITTPLLQMNFAWQGKDKIMQEIQYFFDFKGYRISLAARGDEQAMRDFGREEIANVVGYFSEN